MNYHPLNNTPTQPQGSGRWHQLPTDHDAGAWKRRRGWWKEMNHEEGDSTRRAFLLILNFQLYSLPKCMYKIMYFVSLFFLCGLWEQATSSAMFYCACYHLKPFLLMDNLNVKLQCKESESWVNNFLVCKNHSEMMKNAIK